MAFSLTGAFTQFQIMQSVSAARDATTDAGKQLHYDSAFKHMATAAGGGPEAQARTTEMGHSLGAQGRSYFVEAAYNNENFRGLITGADSAVVADNLQMLLSRDGGHEFLMAQLNAYAKDPTLVPDDEARTFIASADPNAVAAILDAHGIVDTPADPSQGAQPSGAPVVGPDGQAVIPNEDDPDALDPRGDQIASPARPGQNSATPSPALDPATIAMFPNADAMNAASQITGTGGISGMFNQIADYLGQLWMKVLENFMGKAGQVFGAKAGAGASPGTKVLAAQGGGDIRIATEAGPTTAREITANAAARQNPAAVAVQPEAVRPLTPAFA